MKFELGQVAGLRITVQGSALVTLLVMWAVLAWVAVAVIGLPVGEGIVGGLVCAILHYLSEMVHQLGHSIAARQTGYPMTGVSFWGPLGLSIYPKDEPVLAGRIHIRRALGGPVMSLLLTVVAGLAAAVTAQGGSVWWVLLFLFVDNLLVFTLGAFLPLSFTDGSTLLRWWGK